MDAILETRKNGLLDKIEFYLYKYQDTKKLSKIQMDDLYTAIFCSGLNFSDFEPEANEIFRQMNYKPKYK